MRMSCNGCRVLRKGCSHTCSIRPCLQWIKSSDSQANATVFLAKFYGRAGLINLLNAGPDHLRPAIFRSLLYEACGRIVNPVYGSAGLLSSGKWRLTQEAVESVLKGTPITQIPADTMAAAPTPPLAYDIRHICRESSASADLHKVNKPRSRFKRSGAAKSAPRQATPPFRHESACSGGVDGQCLRQEEEESTTSAETGEEAASHVSQGEPGRTDEVVLGLELTLGFQPVSMSSRSERAAARTLCDMSGWDADGSAAGLEKILAGGTLRRVIAEGSLKRADTNLDAGSFTRNKFKAHDHKLPDIAFLYTILSNGWSTLPSLG